MTGPSKKPPEDDPDIQSKEKVGSKPPAKALDGRADKREESDGVEKKNPNKYKIPQKKFGGVEVEPTVNGRRVPAALFQGVKDVTSMAKPGPTARPAFAGGAAKEKEGKTVRFEPSSWNTDRYKTGGEDENFSSMNKWSKSYTPAYHTKVEIEDEAIVDKMVEKILSAEVGTMVNDLMAVSKSVREGVRRKLTMRRVSTKQHNILNRVFDFVEKALQLVVKEEKAKDSRAEVTPVKEATPMLKKESDGESGVENNVSEEDLTSDMSKENAEESVTEEILEAKDLAAIGLQCAVYDGPLTGQAPTHVYVQDSDGTLQYQEAERDDFELFSPFKVQRKEAKRQLSSGESGRRSGGFTKEGLVGGYMEASFDAAIHEPTPEYTLETYLASSFETNLSVLKSEGYLQKVGAEDDSQSLQGLEEGYEPESGVADLKVPYSEKPHLQLRLDSTSVGLLQKILKPEEISEKTKTFQKKETPKTDFIPIVVEGVEPTGSFSQSSVSKVLPAGRDECDRVKLGNFIEPGEEKELITLSMVDSNLGLRDESSRAVSVAPLMLLDDSEGREPCQERRQRKVVKKPDKWPFLVEAWLKDPKKRLKRVADAEYARIKVLCLALLRLKERDVQSVKRQRVSRDKERRLVVQIHCRVV
ncbi:hypothetical protein K435DRAFT_871429 [Dendrothele bispora CBS 962.96]|uniref:Uncharacterized protein n=1 Tax=Dendrothele bispora (strain CBS 962.96) TaxID=1314807 RepID=A0A4S8L471_DENBC|nr:hypothetical protein K435DRAFT_871429 [Dendrothele bispora CBS 962.96]